jgi:gliding motility-associated-like protein
MPFRLPGLLFLLFAPLALVAQRSLPEIKRDAAGKYLLVHPLTHKPLTTKRYDALGPFREGAAEGKRNGHFYQVDSAGREIFEFEPSPELAPARAPSQLSGDNARTAAGNFNHWQTNTGTVRSPSSANVITLNSSWLTGNTPRRQEIIDRVANAGAVDWYADFPLNSPTGGGYGIRLGNDLVGNQAEAVRYTINVPANATDASITFSYAVVFENPNHDDYEQPRFISRFYDAATNQSLDCATFTFVASGPLPGFLDAPRRRRTDAVVRYKPWSSVYVNLSQYAGRTLYLEFTTADCSLGAHFGYAYVDVNACGVSARAELSCIRDEASLKAPPGFQTYTWYAGNNYTTPVGTGEQIILSPAPALGTSYSVIVVPFTNTGCPSCSCRDTLSVTVQNEQRLADAGPDRVVCGSSGTADLGTWPVDGVTYQWSPATFLNDPTISNPVATVNQSQDYVLTATNNSSGCISTDTVHVLLRPLPDPSFTVNNNIWGVCLENALCQTNNTSTISSGTLTYRWNFSDGFQSTATSPAHTYTVPGYYDIFLYATSEAGCMRWAARDVPVTPRPVPTIVSGNPAPQCLNGNSFPFTGSATGTVVGNIPLYTNWTVDGAYIYNTTVSPHFTTTGVHEMLFVAFIASCADTIRIYVTVNPEPRASFVLNGQNNACANTSRISFTSTSTIESGTMGYAWDFGDGNRASGLTTDHAYSAPGTYQVRLVVTSASGCKDSTDQQVTILARPSASAQVDAVTQCFRNNHFQFTNNNPSAAGVSYQWSVDNQTGFNAAGFTYSFPAPGSYQALLVATNAAGCTDTVRIPIAVNPEPVASFTLSGTDARCLNGNQFSVSSTSTVSPGSLTQLWNFGDGGTSAALSDVHSYSTEGPYDIKLVVTTTSGCKDSTLRPVTVFPKPNPVFSAAVDAQCLRNNNFQFSGTSGISTGSINTTWSFGDGAGAVGSSSTHAYTSAGTYPVWLVATSDKGCKDSVQHPVTVHPDPAAAFAISNAAQCLANNQFNFQNGTTISSGTTSPAWTFGDGGISTALNPGYTYTQWGQWQVQLLVVSDKGCRDSLARPVMVHPQPVPVLVTNDTQQCLGGNVFNFTSATSIAAGNVHTILNFGDGMPTAILPATHSYQQAGSYTVNLVATSDWGCVDSFLQQVIIHPHPVVNINRPNQLIHCEGDSLQLLADGAQTWLWTPATGLSCTTCPSPKASPLLGLSYTVQGWNAFGCAAADTVQVDVKHPIRISTAPVSLCKLDHINLSASGAASYIWSPASGLSNAAIASPVFSGDTSITYQLVGYDGFHCFTDTLLVPVTVRPLPDIDAGPDLQMPTGSLQQLLPTVQHGPITSWQWVPSVGLSCSNCGNPMLTVTQDRIYVIRAVNNFGCRSADTLRVRAFCKDAQLFIANVFTPNGDGVNDLLYVQGSGISRVKQFRIFNRWGEMVFEANNFAPNDPRFSWDGKVRGIPGPSEVYVYTAEVVCDNKAEYTYKGNITILK